MKRIGYLLTLSAICISSLFSNGIVESVLEYRISEKRSTAVFNNFLSHDPLDGDNGLPVSPAIDPDRYGPINIMMDVDGNAVEATVTSDISYFEGKYYLYAPSFAYGSFDMAPGAAMTAVLRTEPNSWYRGGGLVIYESDDLMNWKFVSRIIPQDPYTGRVFLPKKTRVIYSEKTKLYNMWFGNGQGSAYSGKWIMSSKTPYGPWSEPFRPTSTIDPTLEDLGRDFDLATGENGETWMVRSHGAIDVFLLNEEKTGVIEKYRTGADTKKLNGGIGIHYENGWWYITGDHGGANPIGSNLVYIMAKDPRGPWLSPETSGVDATEAKEIYELFNNNENMETTTAPVALATDDGLGYAQPNGSSSLPDSEGRMHTFIPAKHYISSPTGAPEKRFNQPGDANLALAGQCFIVLEYDEEGHILPVEMGPSYEFPLAKSVDTIVPEPYQAALNIKAGQNVVQTWTVPSGKKVASVLPAVFQRTPDTNPKAAKTGGPQDAHVNAPLIAAVTLPDGRRCEYEIDSRTVRWNPQQVVLNLPESVSSGGVFTLELSTEATNGGYGIAVGPAFSNGIYKHVYASGEEKVFKGAEMLLRTSSEPSQAPCIVSQPRSVTAVKGEEVGFAVEASGIGLGYQWTKDGGILIAPDGQNESDNHNIRIERSTKKNNGIYQVSVFNGAGEEISEEVELYITDLEISAELSNGTDLSLSVKNNEDVPVVLKVRSPWGNRSYGSVEPGSILEDSIKLPSPEILGEFFLEYSFTRNGKTYTGTYRVHYGLPYAVAG